MLARKIRNGLRGLVVTAAAAGIVLTGGAAAHADPGESVAAYDVAIDVHADGTAHVRETITYDFGGDAKHGIYRRILDSQRVNDHTYRSMDVSNVRVTSPDAPAQADVSDDGSYTDVRVGDPAKTVTGTHTYTIDYDTDHVATKAGGGVRYAWNAVGDEWPVPISNVSVVLTGPATVTAAACMAGASGSTTPCASSRHSGDVARFRQQALDAGTGLTVQADLPAGSVTVAPVYHHTDASGPDERHVSVVPTVGSAIGTGVLLIIALGIHLYVRRRRALIAARPTRPGLPDALTPGLAAYLADDAGERGMLVGTLLDLARRGFLRIDDVPGRRRPDWTITRTSGWDPGLAPHEQALLRGLFTGRDQVTVSQLHNRFRSTVGALTTAVGDEARRRGWAREPYARWIVLACAAPFVLLAFAEITGRDSDGWPFLIAGSGLVIMLILRRLAPLFRLSAAGEDAQRQVAALRTQLADPMAGAQIDPEWALPYAAALNLAPQWEAAMANGGVRQVGWYTGIGLAAFATTAGASMISSPSSSGGGSSGGGGFSGGSVGGGGGGGGGGSW